MANTGSPRIQLADQYYLELHINDQPVLVGISSTEIYITQSVLTKLPTMKLIIRNEPTGQLINFFEAGDAAKITVEIGRDVPKNNPRVIKSFWRQFGAPRFDPSPGGYTITILALLDALPYLNQRVPKSFNATSSAIATEIAGLTGLRTARWNGEASIDSSSDSMSWRPSTMKYPDFIAKLGDCAYDGDTSCFLTGIDEEKTLYFRNVSKTVKKKPLAKFVQSSSTQAEAGMTMYPILEYRVKSKAGTMNNWIGYSFNQGQHMMDGSYKDVTNASVVRGTNHLEMNREVRDQIGPGNARYQYRPLDCGNLHDNLEKARYQNQRVRATFTTQVEVLTEFMTQEDLLSGVGFEVFDHTTREINAMYKGNYVIMAKTRCIIGSRYYEKYVMESQGRSEDKFGFMV